MPGGDPSGVVEDLPLPKSTWTLPKQSAHDNEADLAAPSWSTGAGIHWDEPSKESPEFKWSANDTDLAWTSDSVYHDIQIQRDASHEPETEDGRSLPVSSDSAEEMKEASSRGIDYSRPTSLVLDDHVAVGPSTPPPRSPSPDGFGTFETGLEGQDSAVFPSSLSQDAEDDWASPWMGTASTEEREDARADEWETAKRQKEQLDKKIVRVFTPSF